ncbi:galactose-1-epimerase [Coprinopsis marcescibilis]|uniref:Galactose-1-epimerase n=1 Tax=Coprinopsis marcescibilis TaxID=230819 RepID=A0A5C3L5K6_COPMA|nr:galactose-1-epimerase [Coprinopsis marcescibilis]
MVLVLFRDSQIPITPEYDAGSPFDVTELKAPDGSISASFVSIGATLTHLWAKDRDGKFRDVVLGYDDPSMLWSDPAHPVFSAIVGRTVRPFFVSTLRYQSRSCIGTFSIPISKDPKPPADIYTIPTNDHDGQVTLHGGLTGWDRRNWTVVDRSPTSVTYRHVDEGHEGFPGTVTAYATHTVSNGGVLKTVVRARATRKTPIMVTQHVYWNLDAFQDGVHDTLGHTLQIDSSQIIDLDGNAIPTGDFIDVRKNTIFDFRQPKVVGGRWNETKGLCGGECQGYDHCWVYDKLKGASYKRAGTSLWSQKSGIRLDMATNQDAVQVYSAYWMNTSRKEAHGGPDLKYGKWSGIAIEQQGHVAAINTPEWGIDHIYGPDRPYEWSTTYKFSTLK